MVQMPEYGILYLIKHLFIKMLGISVIIKCEGPVKYTQRQLLTATIIRPAVNRVTFYPGKNIFKNHLSTIFIKMIIIPDDFIEIRKPRFFPNKFYIPGLF